MHAANPEVPDERPLLGALRQLLQQAALRQRTLGYLEVAEALKLHQAPRISRVAALLELLLRQDHAAGRPPVAAMVVGKNGVPRSGFFELLAELSGQPAPAEPGAALRLHRQLLAQLYAAAGPQAPGASGPAEN